ncbi:MAG: UvrB/UvrC motif-containing protein [Clostridiales bacterium]
MLCQRCQMRPATVHVVNIIGQEKKEEYLCDVCAAEQGHFQFPNTLEMPFSLTNVFSDFFASPVVKESIPQKSCPVCGLTLGELMKSGEPGCSKCYDVFGDRIDPFLQKIHGSSRHTGKVPGQEKVSGELQKMKNDLQGLIKEEKFEEAAVLRDDIRRLQDEAGDKNE